MCLTVWPILIWLTAREASSMRHHVERDIAVGLYSRTVFILYDVSIYLIYIHSLVQIHEILVEVYYY